MSRVLALLIGLSISLAQGTLLQGFRHEYQRFNNCGPATLGMNLSYWGSRDNQYQIAPVLKPNKQDKNVNPEELGSYARAKGYRVHMGIAGNLDLLKRLLAAGFPVIAETWFITPDHGGMGHYRLLMGYTQQYFNAFDSYYGPKVRLPYGEFDRLWQVFGRSYLVVYPAAKTTALAEVLGTRFEPAKELALALDVAQRETRAQASNPFAWFNLGTVQLKLGNTAAAVTAFDQSRRLGPQLDPRRPARTVSNWPWRMLWYQFGPYEAYFKSGRYSDVITLASDVIGRVNDHEESYYWRGMARKAQGNLSGARSDWQTALRFKPNYTDARQQLQSLQTSR
jgi:tetratricopeptide (TPR) repeat protein